MNSKEAITQSRSEFIRWAQTASLTELKNVSSKYASQEHAYMWDIAKAEIHARQHRWTAWGFLAIFLTLIFVAIAVSPVVQAWY